MTKMITNLHMQRSINTANTIGNYNYAKLLFII